jgi:hypothetical protein
MMDTSNLSPDDQLALQNRDLSKMSTAGLLVLKGAMPSANGAALPDVSRVPGRSMVIGDSVRAPDVADPDAGAQRRIQLAAMLRRYATPETTPGPGSEYGKLLGAAIASRIGMQSQTPPQLRLLEYQDAGVAAPGATGAPTDRSLFDRWRTAPQPQGPGGETLPDRPTGVDGAAHDGPAAGANGVVAAPQPPGSSGRPSGPAAGSATAPLRNSYDLSNPKNFGGYLSAVSRAAANGGVLDPRDVGTSKALLFNYFGYPLGEQRGTAEELRGNGDGQTSPAFVRALDAFAKAPASEQAARYDLYKGIQLPRDANGNALKEANGELTRARYADLTRDGRTVRVNWNRTFSNAARDVGISADEALRKTDFDVYKAAVDAAFDTDGVQSFDISSAWRPHPADFEAIAGHPPARDLRNEKSRHISSRALDIGAINGVPVDNGGYVSHSPRLPEPDIVGQFTDNLRQKNGIRQIFQPWKMLYSTARTDADFVPNSDVLHGRNGKITTEPDANAILHRNHLHLGF